MRWTNKKGLPEDVRAAMCALLTVALLEAARKPDPGDGSMVSLSERVIGKGMWNGGWKLQSSFIEDENMSSVPFVIVHAYQGSHLAQGSVEANVTRTPEDLRHLKQQRLKGMIRQRNELNKNIERLTAELKGA